MIAEGTELRTPVTVLLLGDPVDIVPGVLLELAKSTFTLRLVATRAAVGSQVVAVAGDTKLAGQITAMADSIATVARSDVYGTDDRGATRVLAPVALQWRHGTGPWRPASVDDVSLSGARFTAEHSPPPIGERITLDLVFEPGGPSHLIEAFVRRNDRATDAWAVAAEFIEVSDATSDALTDLTLRS